MIFNAKRIASTVAWCVVVGSCAFAGQNTKTAPTTAKPAAKRATRASAPRASASKAAKSGQPPVSGAQPVVAVGTGDDAKSAG